MEKPLEYNEEFIVSRLEEGMDCLRQRFAEWGYLYLPGLVAAGECQALLADILAELAPHIIADGPGGARLQGEPFFETDPLWDEVYPRVQALESFHRFFHSRTLLSLMGQMYGTEPFVYPMKMARISTPGRVGYETPPHQDAHSHQAGPDMAGLWVALHAVGSDMGRLKVLPKSHLGGVRSVHEAKGVGGVQCRIGPEENCWHVSDVQQGDVILFNSCTVHKAEPNRADRAVRISVDTRYCPYGSAVFSTNLDPHHGWRIPVLDWDYIYRGWQARDLQHYWRDYPALT